jgi:peptidase E
MGRNSSSRSGQIIAFGGGGFLMEPENPLLDDYVLSLSRARRPKVCFVPTASGDSENMCLRFYDAFAKHKCLPSVLPLFKRQASDLRSFILEQQVVYVGGGNTANMLAVWRVHGLDRILREAHRRGVILCGVSAASVRVRSAGSRPE